MKLDEKALEAAWTVYHGSTNDQRGALSDAILAYLEAATPPDVAGFTPLEWSLTWGPDEDGDESHTASTPFGNYTVERIDGRWAWKYCFDEYYDEDQQSCDSLEEGQKAAQADWNERVVTIFDVAALRLSAGGGVPEGWKLVPVEPTPEMIGAFWRQKNCGTQAVGESGPHTDDYSAYRAMLAASPTVEAGR